MASDRVGRSRYAEQSTELTRFILHLHPFNFEGVILQHFVRAQQHEDWQSALSRIAQECHTRVHCPGAGQQLSRSHATVGTGASMRTESEPADPQNGPNSPQKMVLNRPASRSRSNITTCRHFDGTYIQRSPSSTGGSDSTARSIDLAFPMLSLFLRCNNSKYAASQLPPAFRWPPAQTPSTVSTCEHSFLLSCCRVGADDE